MNAYFHLTRAGLRAFFRDRQGVFWSFFFPLFFIFIFGTIFGHKKDNPGMQFKVGVVVQDPSPAAAWVPKAFQSGELAHILKTTVGRHFDGRGGAQKRRPRRRRGLPSRFRRQPLPAEAERHPDPRGRIAATVRADGGRDAPEHPGQHGARRDAENDELPESDRIHFTALSGEAGIVSASEDRKKEEKLSGMDFLLPGILAMTVMQLGLFTAIPLINLREKGILKRLRATPLPRSTVIGGQVTQRLVIGVIQTLVLLGVGLLVFHFHMVGSWALLLAVVIFGIFTFIGIGAVLASVAKTQESGVSLVQLVNFPMMFLSGLFIPLQILPDGLRSVVGVLPATHLASIMRHIMVDAPTMYSIPASLGVMAAWLAGGLFLASRMFRWE